MTYNLKFHHGDRVLVIDHQGGIEARGSVVGRYDTRSGPYYDVQPDGEPSLTRRIAGLPEAKLMLLGKPYLAYDGSPAVAPRHVLDEA